MAKFCRYCGSQLDESARFCENCGKQAAAAPAPAVPAPATPSPAAQPAASRQKPGMRTISIALSALLVVQTTVVALFGWPGFLVGKRAGATGTQDGPLTGTTERMTMAELVSGVVSEENMTLEKDGVRFAISEVTFAGETNVR